VGLKLGGERVEIGGGGEGGLAGFVLEGLMVIYWLLV
jgi:hypothetical protein